MRFAYTGRSRKAIHMMTVVIGAWLLALPIFTTLQAEESAATPSNASTRSAAIENPDTLFPPSREEVFKRVDKVELKMHIYNPEGHEAGQKRPVIVFFFGGGWRGGSSAQFKPHAAYFASRGMVTMTAEYRVWSRHQARIVDCIEDARSAIRWVRANADTLGIDPERIVASGGSAGGHLAACTATISEFDRKEEHKKFSAEPNAIILFNPALSLKPEHFDQNAKQIERDFLPRAGAPPEAVSPVFHLDKKTPPTLILHGTGDTVVPFAQAKAFAKRMKMLDRPCKLVGYDGQPHGFFNYQKEPKTYFIQTVKEADAFLRDLKYLRGEDQVESFVKKHH